MVSHDRSQLITLARQGNPYALTTLLNQGLAARNLRVVKFFVDEKRNCLQLSVQGQLPKNQWALALKITRVIYALMIPNILTVEINWVDQAMTTHPIATPVPNPIAPAPDGDPLILEKQDTATIHHHRQTQKHHRSFLKSLKHHRGTAGLALISMGVLVAFQSSLGGAGLITLGFFLWLSMTTEPLS